MKIFSSIIFILSIVFLYSNCYSYDNDKVLRYWDCRKKISKIDDKYNEVVCINFNTYMDNNNDKNIIIGCTDNKIIPSIAWKKDLGNSGFITIETKVDNNKIIKSKWKPLGDMAFNFEPKQWLDSLNNGKTLIIRLKTQDSGYEEAEFDIEGVNEILDYVRSSCLKK